MRRTLTGFAAVLVLAGGTFAFAPEEGKYTVKDVMKQAHGGRTNLLNKVKSGNASDAEKAKLLELYESMPTGKPKQGDAAGFKKLGESMVDAAKAAKAGDTGWKEKLTKAANCKGCHDIYKGS